jgi:hypothetical protein
VKIKTKIERKNVEGPAVAIPITRPLLTALLGKLITLFRFHGFS